MSAKQEIADLVARVAATPGWTTGFTGGGHHKITAPSGEFCTASTTPRSSRPLADLRADLRRLGWSEDAAAIANDDRAAAALEADREANERKTAAVLARAERENTARRIAEAKVAADAAIAQANADKKGLIFIPPTPQLVVPTKPIPAPAFTSTASLATPTEDDVDLSDYRSETIYLTYEMALKIGENDQCRQRHLYEKHAMKLSQAMNRGEWRNNPADSLVFDEHEHPCGECGPCKTAKKRGGEPALATCASPAPGCLINGQHRVWAVIEGDWGKMSRFYPRGVPFRATYGFPSANAHIFDVGKSRSASDALTVDGLDGWGTTQAAALRMLLNYDQSFEDDGITSWPNWKSVQWTNSELTVAGNQHRDLLAYNSLASRCANRAKVVKSSVMVAGYVFDRDNPEGGPYGSNQDFWDGVCGMTELGPRDPRMALMRYCMRGADRGRKGNPGLHHLAHILRRYADWNLGLERELSQANDSQPMFPVWQPGMRLIGGELRFDKRDKRAHA